MSQGAKILVVEDDPHIRRLLRATMQRAGHAVVEAADARQAIALLDIERPDVVLLDLGLPDRDGLEMIGLIRLRSTAIVIVVSARDDGAEKVTALDLGADDYVTKPFDTEELLARIRTALRHLRTAAAGEQRSEEHTSELQSLMRLSYAVFCLKKKNKNTHTDHFTMRIALPHTDNNINLVHSYSSGNNPSFVSLNTYIPYRATDSFITFVTSPTLTPDTIHFSLDNIQPV